MRVAAPQARDRLAVRRAQTTAVCRVVLLVDGLLLAIVGIVQVVLQLIAYYRGIGPLASVVAGNPHVVAWVESYGLAGLLGVVLATVARRESDRTWHLLALSVHAFLATANVLFWDSFVVFGTRPAGAAATAVHAALVLIHLRCLHLLHTQSKAACRPPGHTID